MVKFTVSNASFAGTGLHKAIEFFCCEGTRSTLLRQHLRQPLVDLDYVPG